MQEESFMIYKQISAEKGVSQIGILAALDVEDCKNNIIKRHEKTTKDVDVICTEKAKNYRVRAEFQQQSLCISKPKLESATAVFPYVDIF